MPGKPAFAVQGVQGVLYPVQQGVQGGVALEPGGPPAPLGFLVPLRCFCPLAGADPVAPVRGGRVSHQDEAGRLAGLLEVEFNVRHFRVCFPERYGFYGSGERNCIIV